MKNKGFKKILVSVLVMVFCLSSSTQASASIFAVTKCWLGTCGHKTHNITYSNKKVSHKTKKVPLGIHAKPGVITRVDSQRSYSKTSSWSTTLSLGVDANAVQNAFGRGYNKTITLSKGQEIKNNKKVDKEIGLEFKYDYKTCTVKNKHRTYNPNRPGFIWATKRFCKFETLKGTLKATYYKTVGLCLM